MIDFGPNTQLFPMFSTHPIVIDRWIDDIAEHGMKPPQPVQGETIEAMAYLPGFAWVARFKGIAWSSHRNYVVPLARGKDLSNRLYRTFFEANNPGTIVPKPEG